MMKSFLHFKSLLESVANEHQLTHLYHNEEHVLNHGEDGFHHALANLHDVHTALSSKKGSPHTKITQKIDGSPSLIFGRHPINGRHFVATKSAFNKEPKINYTHEDVDKNHGHAPGLASKLKTALDHMHKVVPEHGVYQGDVLHSSEDKHIDGEHVSFKPNTINYSIHKSHPDYKKAVNSKFGIAVHTKYEGHPDSDHHINGMHATFNVDHHNFKHHEDVHLVSPEVSTKHMKYSAAQKAHVENELASAKAVHKSIEPHEYAAVQHHDGHLRKYFNSKIRDGGHPTVDEYHAATHKQLVTDAEKMKSEKGKAVKMHTANAFDAHLKNNRPAFEKAFKLHDHLQNAKNTLVDALSSHQEYRHTVDGHEVKPEGFVVVRHGRPSKLVDRKEFSRLNFENNRGRA